MEVEGCERGLEFITYKSETVKAELKKEEKNHQWIPLTKFNS